jgi:hypothetical protein
MAVPNHQRSPSLNNLVPKGLAKRLAAAIRPADYEKMLAYALLRRQFAELAKTQTFATREELWDWLVAQHLPATERWTYVEFGVFEGYSMRFLAGKNANPASRFIGLDSFEGLPEAWGRAPKGTFNAGGGTPNIDDPRVSFIKGWFQDTWPELRLRLADLGRLVVHYDADLYSSTLFTLSQIDGLKTSYIAMFDEFTGQETRALYNYVQSYNAAVSFLGKVMKGGYPEQVICKITPHAPRS